MSEPFSNETPERVHKRIHVALPLRVTCWDQDIKPYLEIACTYDISAQGARITGLRDVKQPGEIIVVERGRNRAYCRVVWVGASNSGLNGQVGIQCVENERLMWDAELRDLEDTYDPILRDGQLWGAVSGPMGARNRRRQDRFQIDGAAALQNPASNTEKIEGQLRDLSELGCLVDPDGTLITGTDLKLVLTIGNYDLSLKGRVRHVAAQLGAGIEFREIRKGDRSRLQHLLRKLAEQQLEAAFQLEV